MFKAIKNPRKLIILLCTLMLIQHWTTLAQAVPTTETNGIGTTWNDGANWTSGAPTSGVSAGIGHNMTVTANDSFGDGAINSEVTVGGARQLTVNTGVTLTHVAGSTLQKLNAGFDLILTGQGIFDNAGTFQHQQGRILWNGSNVTFNNSGLYEFTVGTDTHVYMNGNGQQFINASGGQVRVNLPSTTDYARIMGGANNATFVQQAGAQSVDWVQGTLIFAPPGGTGSVIDDTAFANLFGTGPIAGTALQLAGGVQIDLTALTDLTRVRLGSSIDSVTQGASIKVAQGIHIGNQYGASPILSKFNTAGGVITNEVGSTIIKDAGVDLQISGNGSFDNKGLFQIEQNRILLAGNASINNSGVLEFTDDNSHIYFNGNNSSVVNKAGGQLRVNLDNPTDLARIMGNRSFDATFIQEAGALAVDWQQGVLEFAPPAGIGETLTDSKFAAMFGTSPNPIPNNAGLQIGGSIDINLTSATDMSRVRLGVPNTFEAFLGTPTGTTINAPNGITVGNLVGGTIAAFNTGSAGSSIINLAGSTITKEAGADMQIAGAGSFENNGIVTLNSNRILLNESGLEFNNNNLVHVVENSAHIYVNNANAVYRNTTDGITRVELPLGTNVAPFTSAANGQLDNQGTIEILRGELDLNTSLNVLQVSGGGTQLIGGNWRILAGAEQSKLDLRASGTNAGDSNQANFDGSITTIGSGTKLVLSEQGAGSVLFPQLGSISTLDGSLYVHGTVDLPVGASPMAVSGTLGGDGTYTAVDSIVFTGGELDPSALDGGAGTLTINGELVLDDTTQLNFSLDTPNLVGGVNDLVQVNGNLTLDGVLDITQLSGFDDGTYRLFNYTGTLTDNGLFVGNPVRYQLDLSTIGQVNLVVVPIPEPSTGLLLLAGIILFRRKRKTNVC